MTEDFKKGLATGLAIGGVTVVKTGSFITIGTFNFDNTFNGTLTNPDVTVGHFEQEETT